MAAGPKVLVLRSAGTNCELETAHVWERVGANARIMHIRELLAAPAALLEYNILTIPGGFSYGDDLGAGRVMAAQLERQLSDQLRAFVEADRLVLGICNGFQVLVHAGLLPSTVPTASAAERNCTVTANRIPGYQDRWVTLDANPASPCVFLDPGRTYELPMAHGEGRVVCRTPRDLASLQERGQDALRFVAVPAAVEGGGAAGALDRFYGVALGDRGVYLGNPNGSDGDIAGLCDESGRVFGMMPHPERFVDWVQHPAWTSLPERAAGDGLDLFERAARYCR